MEAGRPGALFDVAYGFAGAVDELAHKRCEEEEGRRFNEEEEGRRFNEEEEGRRFNEKLMQI